MNEATQTLPGAGGRLIVLLRLKLETAGAWYVHVAKHNRRMVKITGLADLQDKTKDLQTVIKEWLKLVK